MKLKINEFNADLARSVAKYNNYIAKNDKIQNIEPILDHVVGGSGLRKKVMLFFQMETEQETLIH